MLGTPLAVKVMVFVISYLKDIIVSENMYAINMSKYTLKYTKLHHFFKKFWGACLRIPLAMLAGCITTPPIFSKLSPPGFEHGFTPLHVTGE